MQRVTLITGATSGMGKRTAFHLASKGYSVFAGARRKETINTLEQEAEAAGIALNAVQLDVQDNHSIQTAVDSVLTKAGRIDNLVNNAGFGLLATVEDGTDEEIFKQFDVNVFGIFRMCRAILPVMRAQQAGVIVNIGSFLGKMGLPLLAHYNASKYAVEAITDSLRYEISRFGIRVHSVMPGLFGTGFVSKGLLVNANTVSKESPYAELVSHLVPIVSEKINKGPDPIAVAEAIEQVIEDNNAPIRVPVGEEAVTFVPLTKQLSDEDFEKKVKELFGI